MTSSDQYGGASKSKGVYTANTWPDEYTLTDSQDAGSSFRYTKNQYENDIARHLDYGFTLPNGTYTVEVGFANPWSCSDQPTLYANYGTTRQKTIVEKLSLSQSMTASGTVTVTDGTLTLNFKSDSAAINVTYIQIRIQSQDELPKLTASSADIGRLQAYLLRRGALTPAQAENLDANGDGRLNALDLALLKRQRLS